jgi:hypothetical protein
MNYGPSPWYHRRLPRPTPVRTPGMDPLAFRTRDRALSVPGMVGTDDQLISTDAHWLPLFGDQDPEDYHPFITVPNATVVTE